MNMKLPYFLLCCTSLAMAVPAFADGPGGRPADASMEPPSGQDIGTERSWSASQREFRQDYERNQPQGDDERDPMSDADRRQLRRDVNDASREIYRRPGRR